MAKKTSIEDVAAAVEEIMTAYAGEVKLAADEACKEVGTYAKKRLHDTSPKTNGAGKHYANGWAVEVEKDRIGAKVRVWNKLKPGLTHLLENGHLKRNGKDRTKAFPHIAPVEQECASIIGEKVRLEVEKI